MIEAASFVSAAREFGLDWYAGVPCSFLTPFINYVIDDESLSYVSSANEGDAVAAACGAALGGRGGVAMMQNSGLGNAVSPLTSLAHVFRIPLLVICTHRGAPGVNDEPQHALMGTITGDLFDTMAIPWETFPSEERDIAPALERACAYFRNEQRPYALVMQKGTVASHALTTTSTEPHQSTNTILGGPVAALRQSKLPSRTDALELIVEATPIGESVVIATTGFTGRELYALADRPNHLYMVGSMGCASSLGLGLAMARPDIKVVVIDGDGAALMRMGNFATVGSYAGSNFCHVLLDNEAHDSTGAQATVAAQVDFAGIAQACGYRQVTRGNSLDNLAGFLKDDRDAGAKFLHLKIRTGTIDNLPRPAITPAEVAQRLIEHIKA